MSDVNTTTQIEVPPAAPATNPPVLLEDSIGEFLLRGGLEFVPLETLGLPPETTSPVIIRGKTLKGDEKLSKKSGYFIVPYEGKFIYFKIRPPVKRNNNLFDFTPIAKVRREGFVVIDKEIYYVTLDDINRGVIRASRKLSVKHNNVTYSDFLNGTFSPARKPGPYKAPVPQGAEGVPGNAEQSDSSGATTDNGDTGSLAGEIERQAVDLAFEEQIDALLDSIFEKEGVEYEIEKAA